MTICLSFPLRMALWLCFAALLPACSTLRYANKLEAMESSGWEEENFGSYQQHLYTYSGDSITVVYSEHGPIRFLGPPFLPIIPLFGGYTPPEHCFTLSIWHTYTGSDSLAIDKLLFLANGTTVIAPTIDSKYMAASQNGSTAAYREHYRLVFYYPLENINTLHICFDSVSVQGTPALIPPLSVARTKRIYHSFIFTH